MPKIRSITLGCRFNFYESEIIKAMIRKIAPQQDIVIINTCSVTHEAERQSKQAVRKSIRENPDAKIIVTGCAAQTASDYFNNLKGVFHVIQNEKKDDINSYTCLSSAVGQYGFNEIFVNEKNDEFFQGKARVFLQIQNGCDNYCSFCIVPFTRGKSRSLPIDVILKRTEYFVKAGFKEIVFSGIDITSYGKDLGNNIEFGDVLNAVLTKFDSLQRIRISSIDPSGVSDKLFDIIAGEERIMPHLHLSVQSGDNNVLKSMRRRHTREDIISFCTTLRTKRPNMVFGADFITGFPGETDSMFDNTIKLVDEASISLLHVFPYSPRNGTLAAAFVQLPHTVIHDRAGKLRAKAVQVKDNLFKSLVGSKINFIVEKVDSNCVIGKTDQFLPVKCMNLQSDIGCVITDQQVTNFDSEGLIVNIDRITEQ